MAVSQTKKEQKTISSRYLSLPIRVRHIHHRDQSMTTQDSNPEPREPVSRLGIRKAAPTGPRAPSPTIRGRSCSLGMRIVAASHTRNPKLCTDR